MLGIVFNEGCDQLQAVPCGLSLGMCLHMQFKYIHVFFQLILLTR